MAYRICFVCSGNICRSPMAEAVMRRLLDDAGLATLVRVDSAGTGDWHVGDAADRRAVAALGNAGYDGSGHRARAFDRRWFAERDLVVALDRGHLRELRSLAVEARDRDKVRLLRSFAIDSFAIDSFASDTDSDLDVADPYYGGAEDFAVVLRQVEEGCRGILSQLQRDGVGRSA
ncbi:MAG: low molecular weight protein-tyrosine-phosphatase [Actinomycetes bacterium]